MFLHEAQELLSAGKKVTRLSWPAGDHLVKTSDSITFEMDIKDQEDLGIPGDHSIEITPGTLAYCSNGVASLGYVLTSEDRNGQDWEEYKKKK